MRSSFIGAWSILQPKEVGKWLLELRSKLHGSPDNKRSAMDS